MVDAGGFMATLPATATLTAPSAVVRWQECGATRCQPWPSPLPVAVGASYAPRPAGAHQQAAMAGGYGHELYLMAASTAVYGQPGARGQILSSPTSHALARTGAGRA